MAKSTRITQDMIDKYFAEGYWTEETTSDLWERNAKLYPDKEAFVDSKKRLTWSQLKQLSDRLAFGLIELGLKRDELLYMLLPNNIQSYIFRVACEKAGVVCATSLMTVREKEIEYVLKTFDAVGVAIPYEFRRFNYFSAIKVLQSGLPLLKHILIGDGEVPSGTISINEMMERPFEGKYSVDYLEKTKIKATEVSVVGLTSGTTGLPKGVGHAQVQRMVLARSCAEAIKLTGDDVVINVISAVGGLSSPFCYNGSTPLVGAKVILLEVWNPENALNLIEKERGTVLLAVPAQLALLVRQPNLGTYDLSSLRCVHTGTATLSGELAQDVEEKLKVPISNGYGMFDGGLVSITSVDDPPEVRRCTVGKPLKGMEVRLVDDDGNEVPKGQVGEVVFRGPATSAGYYRDTETTLKAWGSLGMDGWFKSGDLAKFDESGNLVIAGRKKEVIKRGGQAIFTAEIEGLLLTHPKIMSVAIIAMPDPIMGEKACAYVALNPGEHLTIEEMLDFLRSKKIAPYKLPERLEIRSELPMRGYQKVAKAELYEDLIKILKSEKKKEGSQ